MFFVFVNIFDSALQMCIRKKIVFFRNDKSCLTIYQKWVKKKNKTMYNDIKINAEPIQSFYLDYNQKFFKTLFNDHLQFKSNIFANLKTIRQKWNFINESGNSQRCKTSITSLKNSFGDDITNQTYIANLLHYKFSKIGDFVGSFSNHNETFKFATKKKFKLKPISIYESQKVLRSLTCNKPSGPSNIPAWTFEDFFKRITYKGLILQCRH